MSIFKIATNKPPNRKIVTNAAGIKLTNNHGTKTVKPLICQSTSRLNASAKNLLNLNPHLKAN